MEKKIYSYETMFVVNAALPEETAAELALKFKAMIEAAGTLTEFKEWGPKRRLAYPINDVTEGLYYLAVYSAAADFPAELDRVFKITEGILRSMTIRK